MEPFHVSLGSPSYFGDNILYLSVNSEQLIHLHREMVYAVGSSPEQIQQYFELDAYVPHLTLGKESSSSGLKKAHLKDMEIEAAKDLSPYPTFEVRFIRIYELINRQYKTFMDLPLGK